MDQKQEEIDEIVFGSGSYMKVYTNSGIDTLKDPYSPPSNKNSKNIAQSPIKRVLNFSHVSKGDSVPDKN